MGRTAVNDTVRSSDDMRDFILQFIEKIIPHENYLLVGKSYGGYLARGLAKSAPTKISGMFLLCPSVFYETQEENAPARTVLEAEEGIEELVPAEEWESFKMFHARQTKEVWIQYKNHILPGAKLADQEFLAGVLAGRKKFTDEIDSPDNVYSFPAVLLAGRQDSCVGYSDLWGILEQYRRASYMVVDKAGHNLEYEQPEIFRAVFEKWLDDVEEYMTKD